MPTRSRLELPETKPEVLPGDEVRDSGFVPFALYSLVEMPVSTLEDLANQLEYDQIIYASTQTIHLVRLAPERILQQDDLTNALEAHIQYSRDSKEELQYFPYGFLAVHHGDWDTNGVYLVHVDFEEPFKVTGFPLHIRNVPEACWTVREDDNGIEQVRDIHEIR